MLPWAIILLLLSVAAVLVVMILSESQVPTDDPIAQLDAFPTLRGTNLLLQNVTVPDDLEGELQLIVVAYDDDQQVFVNKWLRPLEALNEDYPQLRGYYLPLLPPDTANASAFIIGGMTLAAANDTDRARTIVTFTNVETFNELMGIDDTETLQLFLLGENGRIEWRGSGQYDPLTLESLSVALEDLAP